MIKKNLLTVSVVSMACLASVACLTFGAPAMAATIDTAIPAPAPASAQSAASFAAAVSEMSTSPSYVRILLAAGDEEQPKPVCIPAPLLLGAIHREYGLAYRRDDSEKAIAIAIGSPGHAFRFHQQQALDNLRARYSEEQLAGARTALAAYSDDVLKAKFASLYSNRRLPLDGYARDAVACALIERGFSPKMADISGQVFIPATEGQP